MVLPGSRWWAAATTTTTPPPPRPRPRRSRHRAEAEAEQAEEQTQVQAEAPAEEEEAEAPAEEEAEAPAEEEAEAPAAEEAEPTGTLTIGAFESSVLRFLNPLFWTSGSQIMYKEAVSESLLHLGKEGDNFWDNGIYTNALAESWERPDATTYTFNLREGTRFWDGSAVTAEDVKFSYEAVLREDWRHARKSEWEVAYNRMDVPGDGSVTVHLNAPYPLLATYNFMFPIISQAAFEERGLDGFEESPLATGPWELISAVKGEEATLKAVRNHHRKTPFIDELRLRIIPEESTRVASMQTGEIDMTEIEAVSIPQIEEIDGAVVVRERNNFTWWLSFQDPFLGIDSPTRDPRVREAMSLAVNRESIVENFLVGTGNPTGSIGLPTVPGHNEIPPDPFDLETAQALMDASGVGDFDIDFHLSVITGGSQVTEYIQVMTADWGKIGANVNVLTKDPGAMVGMINGHETPGFHIMGIGRTFLDPAQWGLVVFSDGAFSYQDSPELDEKMTAVTFGEHDEDRFAAWNEIQQIINETGIYKPLWTQDKLMVSGPRVSNWSPITGMGTSLAHGVREAKRVAST